MNKMKMKSLLTVMITGSLFLAGCETLSGVGDRVSNLNPFAGDDKEGQGEVAGENERISILSLDEQLVVSGSIKPEEVVLPAPYVNVDYPQVGGNAAHAVQHPVASGSLSRIWSKNIGKGSSRKGRVLAPPVIAGGRIAVMDGNNRVAVLEEGTGNKLWDYKIEVQSRGKTRKGKVSLVERFSDPLSFRDQGGRDKESVGGGVAMADGKVFATSGLGVITALDAVTGEVVWRTPTRTPMHSAPTVSGGRVFAVSDDNELFAFNANTGEVIWTYQAIVETARMLTVPSPAVIDDTVIAPFASGELVAMRVQNGGVLWQDALSADGQLTPLSSLNDISAGPAIADGYVVATAQSGVMNAFDLRTGQRIWTQPAGSIGFPWVAGDFVYSVTTAGEVICVSKIDGTVVWIQELQAFKNVKKRKKRIAWSGPVLASKRLVLFSSRGDMVTINPYNGTIISQDKVTGDVFIPPAIANETIYVVTDDAKIVAFR